MLTVIIKRNPDDVKMVFRNIAHEKEECNGGETLQLRVCKVFVN